MRPFSGIGPRIVFLGDSFTEGTGATAPQNDYPSLVGHELGTADIWQSAFGGTGYVRPLGIRPGLKDRIAPDGIAAQGEIYVVAMGINDSGDILGAVRKTLADLTAGRPDARIFVVGSWNAWGPARPYDTAVKLQIETVTREFPGVVYLDSSLAAFTKSDNTHPSDEGHAALAQWLSAQIRSAMEIDGAVHAGRAGDRVGPLFIKGFDPALAYEFSFLVDGVRSDLFEVVATGDAFPILKVRDGVALSQTGTVNLTIHAKSGSTDLTGRIAFEVRDSRLGSAGDDTLSGTTRGVHLDGLGGNDTLHGSDGNDVIIGGAGNDILDGGSGTDRMDGGPGDDVFHVDSIGDIVIEDGSGGVDSVMSSLLMSLIPDNVENITLASGGSAATGNAAANRIVGNQDANRLMGLGGDDAIDGGAGYDTAVYIGLRAAYTISTAADGTTTVSGPEGTDTLRNVEWIEFPNETVRLGSGENAPGAGFRLFATAGWTGEVGGSGNVVGTNGHESVAIADRAGTIVFDGSFNRGNDTITLKGDASGWLVTRNLVSVARFSDGDTIVDVPVGDVGTAIVFDDGARLLRFDADGTMIIGTQAVSASTAAVLAAPSAGDLTGTDDLAATARMFLSPRAEVEVSGRVHIIGTNDAETVHLATGTITLDASFTRNNDVLTFDHGSARYEALRSGALLHLSGSGLALSTPAGGGLVLDFPNVDRTLGFLGQTIMIGTQVISPNSQPLFG